MDSTLAHYGVKGMKWGIRRDRRKRARTAAALYDMELNNTDKFSGVRYEKSKIPYEYARETLLRDVSSKQRMRGSRYLTKHPDKTKQYEALARDVLKQAKKQLAKADPNRDYRFLSLADHKAEQKRRSILSVSESEEEVERLKWGLIIGNDKEFNKSLKTYQEISLYVIDANRHNPTSDKPEIKKRLNRDTYRSGESKERSEINGLVLKELGYKDTPKSRNDIDALVMPSDYEEYDDLED